MSAASCVQLNEEANFDAVPSRVTVEVGTTPGWSGPAFATGSALPFSTSIVYVSVLVLLLPVTVSFTV